VRGGTNSIKYRKSRKEKKERLSSRGEHKASTLNAWVLGKHKLGFKHRDYNTWEAFGSCDHLWAHSQGDQMSLY
jgi:hypothetical protein